MRISDWSSDVCSSDLYDNAIVGGLGPGGRRRIATVPFQTEGPTIVCRRSMTAMLEQLRVGWNRRRRYTDPVNLLYPFEVDRIHVVRSRPRHPDAQAGDRQGTSMNSSP